MEFDDFNDIAQEITSVMLGGNGSGVRHYLIHCKQALRAFRCDYRTEPLVQFIDMITYSSSIDWVTQALRELIKAEQGLMWLQQGEDDEVLI